MNNPYRQFTVQPRRNARFQANTHSGNYNNLNFHDPALATVRLLSPAVAYANQQMYSALRSNTPVMAVDGTAGYSAVGRAAFTPMYMMNSHPGMAIMPAIPIDFRNQPSGVRHTANFPDAADLLGQCVTENAVPVTESKVMNTGDLLSDDVQIPFCRVQWIPPAVQETCVPQVPYAVEIKPQNDGIPENRVLFGDFPTTDTASLASAANDDMVYVNDQSVPAACLDIATDSSSHNANTRAADVSSVVGGVTELTVKNAAKETGRRKRRQCESYSSIKIFKLHDEEIIKPYSVSLVRLDSTILMHQRTEPNDNVNQFCVADDEEPNETGTDILPVPVQEKEQELLNNQDAALSTSTLSRARAPDELICSGEDVGDGDACVLNENDSSEKSECYEVMRMNSEALLFDMECDDEKDSEALHVNFKKSTAKTPSSLPEAAESQRSHKLPTTSHLSVIPIHLDMDDFSWTVAIEPPSGTKSQHSAARACKDKISVLFDKERDSERDDEPLHVMLPTKNVKTTCAKTASSLPKTPQLHKLPTTSHPNVIPIYLNMDDFSSTDAIEPQSRTKSQRSAARACKDKISVLFDKERDSERDDEPLHVMLPTKNVKTTCAKTASSLPKTPQLHKLTTTSHPSVIPINLDVTVVQPDGKTANTAVTTSQCLAATAYEGKTYATQNRLQTIKIKRSENSLLAVPLHSVLLHFQKDSSQEFRLLLLEPSLIPRNVLALLTNLVSSSSATADDKRCSHSNVLDGTFGRIPDERSRRFLFQCLFCPHGELSAKRVMGHVKQQHRKYALLVQRSLLPDCQTLLYIYCRHCNFITYDSVALLIHFAIYHKVAKIFLSVPNVIESDLAAAPLVNPGDKAREFPFYCCPGCGYIDVRWNRMIHHVLKEPSSESVFFGGVVRLIEVGRGGSQYEGSLTYESLARDERHSLIRKDIYACLSCRFSSFYPTYVLRHFVVRHCCLEILYMCAASPCCPKQCTTSNDIISHIQEVHITMRSTQFRCTATLLDSSTLTQLDITSGEMIAADVPVHINCQSPSSAVDSTSLEAAVERVNDDGDDNDDDDSDKDGMVVMVQI